MTYDLPKAVEVCGVPYDIRSDYRAILDICVALSDPELSEREKAYIALWIFYPAVEAGEMPPEHQLEALKRCFTFIGCDQPEEKENKRAPRLVDWEKDFPYIVAPVNRALGFEVRGVSYLHWWTFVSAFMDIPGDCTFSQVLSIRRKLAHHKKLNKAEQEWYRNNRDLVQIGTRYTEAEENILKQWGGV